MTSFEFNKIAAAILIALLTIKAADLISEHLIHPHILKENVYKIAGVSVEPGEAAPEKKEGPEAIEPLLAKANVEQGAVLFKKCASCHTIDKGGPNRIGPNLYGIVGEEKADPKLNYAFSSAMKSKGGAWTWQDLNVYLYSPRTFVPGTKMSFAGLKNDQERADLIAYLNQQSDKPLPFPKVEAPAPEKPEAQPSPDTPEVQPSTENETKKPDDSKS